jgi:hypothetical protein
MALWHPLTITMALSLRENVNTSIYISCKTLKFDVSLLISPVLSPATVTLTMWGPKTLTSLSLSLSLSSFICPMHDGDAAAELISTNPCTLKYFTGVIVCFHAMRAVEAVKAFS